MKKWKLSSTSWHYKLAERWNPPTDNLCAYTWQVIGGLLLTFFVFGGTTALVCFLLFVTIMPYVAWVTEGIFPLFVPDNGGLMLITLVFTLVHAFALLAAFKYALEFMIGGFSERRSVKYRAEMDAWWALTPEEREAIQTERERQRELKDRPGFLKLAYRSFKDKTCVRLEFDE